MWREAFFHLLPLLGFFTGGKPQGSGYKGAGPKRSESSSPSIRKGAPQTPSTSGGSRQYTSVPTPLTPRGRVAQGYPVRGNTIRQGPTPEQRAQVNAVLNQLLHTPGSRFNDLAARNQMLGSLSTPFKKYYKIDVNSQHAVDHAGQYKSLEEGFKNHPEDAPTKELARFYAGQTAQEVAKDSTAATLSPPSIGRAAAGIGKAFYEDPGGTASHTLQGARDIAFGTPAALLKLGVAAGTGDTKTLGKVGSGLLADFSRRYGGSTNEISKIAKKEGVASYGLDALAAVSGGSGAVGKVLEAAGKTARARPVLRVAGGAPKVQATTLAPTRATIQRATDALRTKVYQTSAARRVEGKPYLVSRRARGKGPEGTERALTPKEGEVVPLFPSTAARAQRISASGIKARMQVGAGLQKNRLIQKVIAPTIRGNLAVGRKGFNDSQRDIGMYLATTITHANARTHASQIAHDIDLYRRNVLYHRSVSDIPDLTPKEKLNDIVPKLDTLVSRTNAADPVPRLTQLGHDTFTPQLERAIIKMTPAEREAAQFAAHVDSRGVVLRRNAPHAELQGLTQPEAATTPIVQRGHLSLVPELTHHHKTADAFAERVNNHLAENHYTPRFYWPEHHPNDAVAATRPEMTGAIPAQHARTGEVWRRGVQQTHVKNFLKGIEKSVESHHNWNAISEFLTKHSDPAINGEHGGTIGELERRLIEHGKNPGDYKMWNPGDHRQEILARHNAELSGANPSDIPHIASSGEQPGWFAVDKNAAKEFDAKTEPWLATKLLLDIPKKIQTQTVLGSSPSWLGFQVFANQMASRIGSGVRGMNPLWGAWENNFLRRANLTTAERDQVMTHVGATGGWHDPEAGISGPRTSKVWVNMSQTAKAFSKLDFRQYLLEADRLQNQFHRTGLGMQYISKLARDRNLQSKLGDLQVIEDHVGDILKTNNHAQRMAMLLKERPVLEQMGQHVNDILGDFLRYTHRERQLSRISMFYGFLRYSTKLTFYTLPINHPLVTALIGKLGQLHSDEVRKFLGGDEVPSEFGNILLQGGKFVVQTARANPALDSFTQSPNLTSAMTGTLPFLGQEALAQAFHTTPYTGKPFSIEGIKTPPAGYGYLQGIDPATRGRIALNDALSNIWPVREADKYLHPGPKGADTLPWNPRYIKYRSPQASGAVGEQTARQRKEQGSLGHFALQEMFPFFVKRPSHAKELAAAIRSAQAKDLAKRHGGKKSKPSLGGSGASLGGSLGGKGGSLAPKP